jgi:protein-S-isoprenylcysteine O-methyltransferase Ste14
MKSLLGISLLLSIIFIAAGKLNYQEGLTYAGLSILGFLVNILTTKENEGLIEERSKPGPDVKTWDKKILGIMAMLTVITYVIAGLDSGRFGWSPSLGQEINVIGIILIIIGQLIFATAKYQNDFFSSVSRIQKDRKHQVCNRGLYSIMRHPGYLGMIISWIGFPLVMNSIYSFLPVTLSIITIMVRTRLEDNMLMEELDGYKDYAKRIRYRIIPLIW